MCLTKEKKARGKMLLTGSHRREIPLEDATESPLDISSENSYTYIYIYTYICISLSLYIYIYIYIYV